ncbi:MAG: patatin-like phospholipase family protein [Eudoraea sp.]|nr:patatin-like phospholipase family protein [Eudoraea sp.]
MKTGLVLSGGGVRGIAHIGAIKALEEHGIIPDIIAGTSAGAIVGALYAGGNTPEEILHFFKSVNPFSISNYAVNKPGFVNSEKLYPHFKAVLPQDTFEALKIPLVVTATNILEGTLQVFRKGALIRAVIASAAFPGIFTPVRIGDDHYVDGGTLNNFPADLIQQECNSLIGVHVNPFEKVALKDLKYFYNVVERSFQIRSAMESMTKFSMCDLVICPEDLGNFSTFSMREMDKIYLLGYTATNKALATSKGKALMKAL